MEGWRGCGQGPVWPWDQKPREGADVLGKHVQWASADICVTAAFVALKSVDVSAQCQLSEGRTGVGCTLSSPAPGPPGTAVWLEWPFDFTASYLQIWSVTMTSTIRMSLHALFTTCIVVNPSRMSPCLMLLLLSHLYRSGH